MRRRTQWAGLLARAAAILCLLGAGSAGAEDTLWGLLAAQESARGSFQQEVYDEEGQLLERSSGRYAVLRPGYFRWEIDFPDRQLLLVSGDTLWHYDMDLATATRRRTGDDNAFAPLELLGGELADLRGKFLVTDLGDNAYRLEPTYPAAGFASVELAWQDDALRGMTVLDRSGQALQLALTPESAPEALQPEDFEFSVPDGVEVYYDDGL